MKLHLPGNLRAAVISALFVAPALATSALADLGESMVVVNKDLTIEGDSGSYVLKADAINKELGSIQTTGADIKLDNIVNNKTQTIKLQEASTMEGGTLTLSFSASKAAANASSWLSNSSDVAFSGATLRLNNVKVVLNQIEGPDAPEIAMHNGFMTSGIVLYTISNTYGSYRDWNCTLEVNAPLLDKYFTNYRFSSDTYYYIEPIRPYPYPIYPDYNVIMADETEQTGSVTADGAYIGGEIIIEPIYPIYPIYPRRGNITVVADRELDYYGKRLRTNTPNGRTGMELAGYSMGLLMPQLGDNRNLYPDLAAVMDALDVHVANNNHNQAEKLATAFAGSPVTTLGHAALDDMHRQLRSMRNRIAAPSAGHNPGKSRFTAVHDVWFNAEGDYRHLEADRTAAGYKLDSWGGTFGMDFDLKHNLVAGVAATVMFGDLRVDAPATAAEGDMDSFYLNFYARYTRRAWTNTLVMSFGHTDFTMSRTVDTGMGVYSAHTATSGNSFGLLYELSYDMPLSKGGDSRLQPLFNFAYRHVSVNGYTETGSDAALRVGEYAMDTVTLGAGARLQRKTGRSLFNREAMFEARALVKLDTGDRYATTTVDLAELDPYFYGIPRTIRGAKANPAGLELGAGLYIPVRKNQTLFFDLSTEFRRNSPNLNGTAGYRISF